MARDVYVVGSVNLDLVVRAATLPGPGETVTGGTFERHGGGKSANQAVAAARQGATVRMVGAVGSDDLGDEAVADLAGEGVDVSAVARVTAPTGVALIAVDEAGENQIAVASGANNELTPEAVEAALAGAEPGGVVLIGLEVPDAPVLAAARAARAADLHVVLNPAPAPTMPPSAPQFAEVDEERPGRRAGRGGGARRPAVAVPAVDNGGTADGGDDTSSTQTFQITVSTHQRCADRASRFRHRDHRPTTANRRSRQRQRHRRRYVAVDLGDVAAKRTSPSRRQSSHLPTRLIVPGADSFSYTITDGNGEFGTAIVSITVIDRVAPKIKSVRIYAGRTTYAEATSMNRTVLPWEKITSIAIAFNESVTVDQAVAYFDRSQRRKCRVDFI